MRDVRCFQIVRYCISERLVKKEKGHALSEASEDVVPIWKKKGTGMEAKVVCLLNPDLLEAPGFGEFLDPECCV